MSLLHVLLALSVAGVIAAPSHAAADREKDEAAIVEAALNYADGYYSGSGERMARAVSPMLTKRGLLRRSGVDPFLVQMNAEMLVDAARSGRGKIEPERRNLAPKVLDVDGDIASAQIFTSGFNDYLHLVKRDGEWRLVNVLWHPPIKDATGPADADRAAVEQAVGKLVAGLAAGDASSVKSLLHPLVAWRHFASSSDDSRIVVDQNIDSILASLASGQKAPVPPDLKVEVLGVDHDIASVKVAMDIPTYMHLARQQGAWRVVNVLRFPSSR